MNRLTTLFGVKRLKYFEVKVEVVKVGKTAKVKVKVG